MTRRLPPSALDSLAKLEPPAPATDAVSRAVLAAQEAALAERAAPRPRPPALRVWPIRTLFGMGAVSLTAVAAFLLVTPNVEPPRPQLAPATAVAPASDGTAARAAIDDMVAEIAPPMPAPADAPVTGLATGSAVTGSAVTSRAPLRTQATTAFAQPSMRAASAEIAALEIGGLRFYPAEGPLPLRLETPEGPREVLSALDWPLADARLIPDPRASKPPLLILRDTSAFEILRLTPTGYRPDVALTERVSTAGTMEEAGRLITE